MPAPSRTDWELVSAARNGDRQALETILAGHAAMVYNACLRILGNATEAEDAAQATFLVFLRKLPGMGRGTMLAAWFHRTASFVCRDHVRARMRRERRERRAATMREALSKGEDSLRKRLGPVLDEALSALPAKYRSALVLTYMEGRSRSEAAAAMGVPEGTVATWVARGLEKLRSRLGPVAVSGGAALGAMIAAEATATAAPAGLVSSVMAAAGAAGTASVGAAAVSQQAIAMTEGAMKAMFWVKVKAAVAAAVTAAAVCAGGAAAILGAPSDADGGEAVWATGPSHKVLRTEKAPESEPIWDPATRTVKLHAARNEFVSFQLVFPGPLQGVDLPKLVLAGPGDAKLEHVQVFREHYLKHVAISQFDGKTKVPDCVYMDGRRKEMGAPQEYPVQMVPKGAKKHAFPFDVADGVNEVVWVDVFVPEDAQPGAYRGDFIAAGRKLKVELTVWNFTLSSVSHFPHWAYVGPENISYSFKKPHTEIKNMMPVFDGYFQMAHDHRLSMMETLEYGPDYMKAPDRKFHDYYTGTAFKGPFGAGFGYELLPLSGDSRGWLPVLEREKWLNRAFFYLMDEPNSKDAYQRVLSLGRAVRENTKGKAMRFVTEQFRPSRGDWPSLDPEVDIFCSGGIAPGQVAHVESKGNVVWTYNAGHAGGPYTDAPGSAMRTHAWAGFISGSRAWFFWEAVYVVDWQNRWRHDRRSIRSNPAKYRTDVWNVAMNFDEATKRRGNGLYPAAWSIRLNGDGLLIYPGLDVGVDGPIAGFRLKNLRRGAQDFEYLYLLEKMGRKEAALAEAKRLLGDEDDSVTSKDGQSGKRKFAYEKDASKWDAARIRLGGMLHEIGEDAIRAKIEPYNQYPNPVGHPDYYGGKRY